MSLTLDINNCNCLQNGVQGEMDIAAFHKQANSIFEEIENLIKCNKTQETQRTEEQQYNEAPTNLAVPEKDGFTANATAAESMAMGSLDMLSPAHEFLISESQNYNEDPLLYSVERDELQPITSPFMVPGIYKKIATATLPTASASAVAANESDAGNVFISEKESQGRVVSVKDFHNLYVCASESSEAPPEHLIERPRTVVLLEPMEESDNNDVTSVVKPALTVMKNDTLVPKQWDALSKLAYDILKLSNRDHIVIDRKRNEIVRTERDTNQKTIYRFLAPEALGLTSNEKEKMPPPNCDSIAAPKKPPTKLGRPKKRLPDPDASSGALAPKIKNQQQQKKETMKKQCAPEKVAVAEKPPLRTRSERLVKVVKPVLTAAVEENVDEAPTASAELMRNFLAELKDSDFKPSSRLPPTLKRGSSQSPLQDESPPMTLATSSPTKRRRVPPEAICPTCKKIFLGPRLQRHFVQHPDHMKSAHTTDQQPDQALHNNEDMTMFRFLISKLQKSRNLSEDQRADMFLNEINDLVTQLQMRCSRLIRNTSGLHFVTTRTARVLGIPEGQYGLDMSAIEAPPDLESNCLNNYEHLSSHALPAPHVNTRSLDYTGLSVSLDDTLTDEAAQKLNLSAGGKLLPPSEESLLRAVDDLVHVGMKNLSAENLLNPPVDSAGTVVGSTLMPHYDQASDNAVEAVSMKPTNTAEPTTPILDLTVDFFQFNNH